VWQLLEPTPGECIASTIRLKRISDLEILAVTSSVHLLVVTGNVVPRSLILFTLIIEAILSSETSVLTRLRKRHILEDGILHRITMNYI
jgi:hypothetical protein